MRWMWYTAVVVAAVDAIASYVIGNAAGQDVSLGWAVKLFLEALVSVYVYCWIGYGVYCLLRAAVRRVHGRSRQHQ